MAIACYLQEEEKQDDNIWKRTSFPFTPPYTMTFTRLKGSFQLPLTLSSLSPTPTLFSESDGVRQIEMDSI